jgi:hypothetical protein
MDKENIYREFYGIDHVKTWDFRQANLDEFLATWASVMFCLCTFGHLNECKIPIKGITSLHLNIPISATDLSKCNSYVSHDCEDISPFSHCWFEKCQQCLEIDQALTNIIELYQPQVSLTFPFKMKPTYCVTVTPRILPYYFLSSRERLENTSQLIKTLNGLHMPTQQISETMRVLTHGKVTPQIP